MRFNLAFPDKATAVSTFTPHGFEFTAIEYDENNAPVEYDLKTSRHGSSFIILRNILRASPTETVDANGDEIPVAGAILTSGKGYTYHVDAYLYSPLIEVEDPDAPIRVYVSDLLTDLEPYLVTIPDGVPPVNIVEGVG